MSRREIINHCVCLFGHSPDSPHYVLRTSAITQKCLWDVLGIILYNILNEKDINFVWIFLHFFLNIFLGSHPTAPTTSSEHLQSHRNVLTIFLYNILNKKYNCFLNLFALFLKYLFGQPPDSPQYVHRNPAII